MAPKSVACLSLALLALSAPCLSAPLPAPLTMPSWIAQLMPSKSGSTPADEVRCYSLPYGWIGILSHLLTYWTVICLGLGRKPLWPFGDSSKLQHDRWDFAFAILSVLACIPLATITMVVCRNSWQFVLLAVWKLTMSFTLACVGLHRAVLQKRGRKAFDGDEISHAPFWWLTVYAAGIIVGMTGLGSLVAKTWGQITRAHMPTYIFSAIVGTLVAVVLVASLFLGEDPGERFGWGAMGSVLAAIFAFGVLSALYSDMVLAAIANNWSGAPFDDNKYIFWAWFAAKRLPILSF